MMDNIFIKKVDTPKYFNHKPLPFHGEYMPIPSPLPGYLFQAEVFYKFNQAEYKTPPGLIEIIKKPGVVIISGKEFAVGLRYIAGYNAPIVVYKGKCTGNSMRLCEENRAFVEYDEPFSTGLYHDVGLGCEIPQESYEAAAAIFARAWKAEKNASRKNKGGGQ
jgi:type III secretion system FlhB-like substrate exporter